MLRLTVAVLLPGLLWIVEGPASGIGDKGKKTNARIEKTAFGKKLSFCTEGPQLIATLRYLHRYGSPNMQWE